MKYILYGIITLALAASCSKGKDENSRRYLKMNVDGRPYSLPDAGVTIIIEPVKKTTFIAVDTVNNISMNIVIMNDSLGTYTSYNSDSSRTFDAKIEFTNPADPNFGEYNLVSNDEFRKGTLTVDNYTNYDFTGTFTGTFSKKGDTLKQLTVTNGLYGSNLQ